MEQYIGEPRAFSLYVYSSGVRMSADSTPTVTAVDIDTGETVSTTAVQTISVTGEKIYDYYTSTLAASEINAPRKVEVTWTYDLNSETFTKTDTVDVVQPLVTYDEVIRDYPEFAYDGADPKTYEEIRQMEQVVRYVIEAYTQNTFAPLGTKTLRLYGSGSNYLTLQDHIYDLEFVAAEDPRIILYDKTVSGEYLYARDDDGVQITPATLLNNKETEIVTWDNENPWVIRRRFEPEKFFEAKAHVSHDLLRPRGIFESKKVYLIRAKLGWKQVPSNVKIAAKILIDDYFNNDFEYHKRGIDTVSSADWRMEFADNPKTTTGNVVVDQILSDYRSPTLVII